MKRAVDTPGLIWIYKLILMWLISTRYRYVYMIDLINFLFNETGFWFTFEA